MIFRSKKIGHTSKLDHAARELSEDELALVSGGKKSGSSQVDYLTVVVKEAVITTVSF
jgi:bacteriocin-like protein